MTALPEIRARQEQQYTLPGERFVDSGYVSGENIKDGRPLGEDLIGPIRTTVTPQSKLPDGFTHVDFQIDFELRQVTCPGGQTTPIISSGKNGEQAIFPRKTCAACPLRPRCCTGQKEGRALSFGPQYQETQAARKRQLTDDFKHKYRAHRGGVEGCLSALVRGHGIRTTRYDGQTKNHLHALFVGAAVNLARSAAWANIDSLRADGLEDYLWLRVSATVTLLRSRDPTQNTWLEHTVPLRCFGYLTNRALLADLRRFAPHIWADH